MAFTTFTGNSRRPRQVNLGGRHANPFGSSASGSHASNSLLIAQQEREERQHQRARKYGAETAQRLWRGKQTRRNVRNMLRHEWDAGELPQSEASYNLPPYQSEKESWGQLQKLLLFFDARDSQDVLRLRVFALRQMETMRKDNLSDSAGSWPRGYLKLWTVTLASLELHHKDFQASQDIPIFLMLLQFLTRRISVEVGSVVEQFFKVMLTITTNLPADDGSMRNTVLATTVAPLKRICGAYEAFAFQYLTKITRSEGCGIPLKGLLSSLAPSVDSRFLAKAIIKGVKEMRSTQHQTDYLPVDETISVLACLVYFHRQARDSQTTISSPYEELVNAISSLFSLLPDDISLDGAPSTTSRWNKTSANTAPEQDAFLKEQISSLVDQDSVKSLLSFTRASNISRGDAENAANARSLANYALTLIRLFPSRGDEIRMWLYLGSTYSPEQAAVSDVPTIKYFWQASRTTTVFQDICRDSRAAIRLLKPKTSTIANGYSWQAPTTSSNEETEDDWRVVLILLELYTFVLKVMDDEEFFSGAQTFGNSLSSGAGNRGNPLSLDDIQQLTIFLKNLGFTTYFNAADINSAEETSPTSNRIGSWFSIDSASQSSTQVSKAQPRRQSSVPINIDHLKGLTTGLLRMIYERDSRRPFLPKGHWLMTSRFDMEGFIPAVVAEEESRNQLEDGDDEELEDEDTDDDDTMSRSSPLIGTRREQQMRNVERLKRQQKKASKKRYLAQVAPRLEILQNMPFFIPFTTRVQIFRQFVALDQIKRRGGSTDPEVYRMQLMHGPERADNIERHRASVARGQEFDDAYHAFWELKEGLKEPIQITFVDRFGAPEAGIDGGGVTKEFLTSVTNQAFSPTNGIPLFKENDQNLLYPNPLAVEEQKELLRQIGFKEGTPEFREPVVDLLQRYEFLGRIIGKCLYEGILVDINFAGFFLLKWALTGGNGSAPKETGYRANLNDLRDLDEGLYQGLIKLKNTHDNVEDWDMTFAADDELTTDVRTGATRPISHELKPNGANSPVTNSNRLIYISYLVRYRLQVQPYAQTNAFLRGLSSMIQPSWLSMFNQSELQTLIGGTSNNIDIMDLRRHTQYSGVYVIGDDGQEHPTIALFWQVMDSFPDADKRAVLKFVTSTPRAPLLGFGSLEPRFSIRDSGADEERLPSASTCVNLLKLPRYKSERAMREKLLYAANSGAGFDLS
ncbi:hypothetical protein K402DRAFT_367178 [Aulographum hederae CBS 113979]|uniref:HECT-type E3 ubiquitin transferase n=1 Tax=Aulographum hederae CBS 113979 TaxID=1176131 RepID=A0A6G1HF92_9PEZI|nr:hypothetical protein K402DRAFT_367178 [Aulographum hederae CBS 113979]